IIDTQTSLADTWKTMIELQKTGKVSVSIYSHNGYLYLRTKVKHIGVSNFTIAHIKGIVAATGVKPLVNQIEAHPLLPQDNLVAFCKEEGIHITAYSPLGNNCWSILSHRRAINL